MWNIKRYKKICLYSEIIQKKFNNLSSICNSYLHIIRAHPFILQRYDDVFLNRSFFYYLSKFFRNFSEIFLKFISQFFYREILKTNETEYKILVLGHITNFESFSNNVDFQYGNFFKNKKKSILYFYINSDKNKKYRFKTYHKINNLKKNFFIFNYKLNFLEFFKYFNFIYKNFYKTFIEMIKLKTSDKYYKNFLLNTSLNLFSYSTIQNLIFYYKFRFFVKKYSIRKIVTTFEGHPFEKLIFKIGKENSIQVDAYQHSFISDTHHSIYVYSNLNFLPSRILTSGAITYKIFKKYFKNKTKVELIGSTKFKNYKPNTKKFNSFKCLVVPEGFYEETEILISFCLEYLKKYQNIEFIIRLHPEVTIEKLIKKNNNFNFNKKKIIISKNKIIEDVKKCNLILYRGSTFAADAIGMGLKPFYLKRKKEIEIDSLWMFKDNFKEKISNIDQLNKIILRIENKKNSYKLRKKTTNFSKSFYGKFNEKIKI